MSPTGVRRILTLKQGSIFYTTDFTVHKIVRVVASRPLTTSSPLAKAPTEPTPPTNSDVGGAATTGGGTGGQTTGSGGDKKNTLTCPKCGDPCTHVETFVCKCWFF